MNYYELAYRGLAFLILFFGVFMGMIAMYIRLDYVGAIDTNKIEEAKNRTMKENFKLWYDRESYKAWAKK